MATIVTTRPCIVCHKTSEVEMTDDELNAYNSGQPIQNALPEWSADDRELLISGTHSTCWDKMFG